MLLIFASFTSLLSLFVFELAIVHDLANRRLGVGGDLNEVEVGVVSKFACIFNMHDANLLPIRSNKSNLGYSDSLINASFSADGNSSSSKVDYVIYRYSLAIPVTYEKPVCFFRSKRET